MKKDIVHLKSPGNWINDPNGFIYYKGKYHLFYQNFPYAPVWGTMHWGHAVSEDLVSWEHREIALFPSKAEDQNGCFSGSAVELDGKLYLFYTGVHYEKPDPENIHLCLDEQYAASQMLLCSEDGFYFDNFGRKRVVIPAIEDKSIGDRANTRDPKVWRGKDAWYMVLGTRSEDNRGSLLFYKSTNLTEWIYVNRASKEGFGWMWECPDYFETEGGKVLLLSPLGMPGDGKEKAEQTICALVAFEEETCTMAIPDTYQFLDYGLDLYAAQSTVDADGRRILTAWLRMPEPVNGEWSGMFCIPRVVEVKDGHIYFRVHPNVESRFARQISSVKEADAAAGYRLSLDMEDKGFLDIGGYQVCWKNRRICTNREKVFRNYQDYRLWFETPEIKGGCHLDIYVDKNLIEIYVNEGEYVISNAVYDLKEEIFSEGIGEMKLFTV